MRYDREAPGYISPQTKILNALIILGNGATTKEIANQAGLTQGGAHDNLRPLKSRGFVTKETKKTGGIAPGLVTRWFMRPQRMERAHHLVREAFKDE